jgi:hypothetical protein
MRLSKAIKLKLGRVHVTLAERTCAKIQHKTFSSFLHFEI